MCHRIKNLQGVTEPRIRDGVTESTVFKTMSRTLISPLIKSTFHCGRHKSVQPRLLSTFEKFSSYSRSNIERLDVLKKVYSPLLIHKEGTQEWSKLIKSGKIWEDYFRPFEWYFQAEYADFLKAIDGLKASSRISSVDILKRLTVDFAQHSCAIEGNTLKLAETQKVWNTLKKNFSLNDFLKNIDTPLPAPSSLSDKPENEVIEVRNHLLATYFLYNTFYESGHEIDLDGIKTVHRIMLKDTSLERIEFEVEARGSIYTVYPLPLEVPALMKRFIQFRDESQNSGLHPLIIASRILSTFLHVHPFADDIPREEYTSTLFLAQAEKDSIPLYALVVQNIFNILMRYQA
ncbi:30068_t:CDS:2 [Gigaspora margarita]|uniref:30068_t:CDS:1 n=1 Tax=Gigaspora margarita TaxID=4874 RepID=A0ABN7UNH7_GIGMA|nr:30068_t:CDS:2 [Gigaspora margarita]